MIVQFPRTPSVPAPFDPLAALEALRTQLPIFLETAGPAELLALRDAFAMTMTEVSDAFVAACWRKIEASSQKVASDET